MSTWAAFKTFALLLALVLAYYLGGEQTRVTYERKEAQQAAAVAKAWQERELRFEAAWAAEEKELNGLKNAIREYPTVPVQLCRYRPLVSAAAKPGPHVPAAPGVGKGDVEPVPQSAGEDVGPIMFGLADALDTITAKCRHVI